MKLTIEKLVPGGDGIARMPSESGAEEGMRVFVPFTLPEEIVEARITGRHRGYASGEAQRVESASAFRVDAACSRFGSCGGCQLQHSSYAYQLQLKREMLAESLRRAGLRDLPEISILAGTPFEYRNRVRLQIQTSPEFSIGYRAPKSHRIVAIDECPVAARSLQSCIAALKNIGTHGGVPAGTMEVEAFANHDQTEMLLTVWTAIERKFQSGPFTVFLEGLRKTVPQLSGAAVHAANGHKASDAWPIFEWRRQALCYRAAEQDYTVSHGSFFQVNAPLIDAFVDAAIGDELGERAWDLYAGAGLFSRVLATRFQHVTAVEAAPGSSRDLRKNLRGLNVDVFQATTLDFLRHGGRTLNQQRPLRPDLILLDPPRAGAGKEVCDLLAREAPARIVYVSCDPATLGRDLARLIQSGYRLTDVQMVDMFPQTGHVETIAKLQPRVP